MGKQDRSCSVRSEKTSDSNRITLFEGTPSGRFSRWPRSPALLPLPKSAGARQTTLGASCSVRMCL